MPRLQYSRRELMQKYSEAMGISTHHILVIVPELDTEKTDVRISEELMISRKTVGRCRREYQKLCESDMWALRELCGCIREDSNECENRAKRGALASLD